MLKTRLAALLLISLGGSAMAKSPASCEGVAALGAAQLLCSQNNPQAPTQICTFSWALVTTANAVQVVEGSFTLPPHASNVEVYQGSGFASASSSPIVLCQSERPAR